MDKKEVKLMPDEITQPATVVEPAPMPSSPGHEFVSVVDPPVSQSSTEPLTPGTVDSPTPTMPPEAQNGPLNANTNAPAEIPETPVSTPLPQNQTPTSAPQPTVIVQRQDPRSFLSKALAVIQFRKKAKLEKITKLALVKKSITNDQVEKLLRVSDATASRYLLQLLKEGRLKKVGPDGRARYEPI